MIERSTCRLCNSYALDFVFSFPLSPLADRYAVEPNSVPPKFPQDIYVCRDCGHVQIINVISPNELFDENYTYRPSRNNQLSDHWTNYADVLIQHIGFVPEKVLDIGSNDGSLLRAFKERGSQLCLGVEPVSALTAGYSRWGLNAVVDYWSPEIASRLKEEFGTFDLICANNVFAHNDDLHGFTQGISKTLALGGYFSTEFSYLEDIICSSLVGVFFHEHLSHHHLLSLIPFLESHGLFAVDARRVGSQGGALNLIASSTQPSTIEGMLSELIAHEREALSGHDKIRSRLVESILKFRNEFMQALRSVDEPDKRIVLFGASRSANLFVDFLGIRAHANLVVDSNPQKIGHFLFESSAQIYDQSLFQPLEDDIVIITAWAQTPTIEHRVKETYKTKAFTLISLCPSVSVQIL